MLKVDELKAFTPAELKRLERTTGLTPHHLAQFLEVVRLNIATRAYSTDYIYEETSEEPIPRDASSILPPLDEP